MVAGVVPGVAVVGKGGRHRWSRWRCRRAAALRGPAAVSLLSGGPSPLPIGVAGIAVVRARCRRGHYHGRRRWGPHDHRRRRRRRPHDHRWRRWRCWGGGTADVVMQAAPHLLALCPRCWRTDGAVRIRRRRGWGWRLRCWRRGWKHGRWKGHRGWWSRRGDRRKCRGDWLGAQLWQQVQEEGYQEHKQDAGNDARAHVRPEIGWYRDHCKVPGALTHVCVCRLLLVISTSTNVRKNT